MAAAWGCGSKARPAKITTTAVRTADTAAMAASFAPSASS